MSRVSRRQFIQSTSAGLAAAAAFAHSDKASGAVRILRHAVIGCGSQGRNHARTLARFDDCEVVAVCDVDPERRERAATEVADFSKAKPVENFRRILDDDSIDTVSIATPDHWHTPIAIMALQAGKHVYVEKPCTHNVYEGVVLARAANKYGKCIQHGTQSRSGQGIREAIAFLRAGELGKVRMAKAINHQLRGPIGQAEPSDPPPGVDYDLWLGPAPKRPFTANRWHYNWHWFWDYGTGDMGNDGIHQIDIARWGLGVGAPKAVSAPGGQLFYNDDHETPDTQTVVFEFDDSYLQYEMRLWTDYPLEGHDNGNVFYGDKGKLEIGRNGCEVTFIGEPKRKIGGGADLNANFHNFLDCVKAGSPDKLNAPIEEGIASALLCHLGNVATRVGRKLDYDATNHTIVGDTEANGLLKRDYRDGYALPTV